MNRLKEVFVWMFIPFIATALLAGCAYSPRPKPGESFPCAKPEKIEKVVANEAELVDLSCAFKKWSGQETLHLKVAIKNMSSEPQRFRVQIFLDNGKAVGGFIPRKTKKGLIKPGQIAKFVYPVMGVTKPPKSLTIIIKTVGK